MKLELHTERLLLSPFAPTAARQAAVFFGRLSDCFALRTGMSTSVIPYIRSQVLPRFSGHLKMFAIMLWEVSDDKKEAIVHFGVPTILLKRQKLNVMHSNQ